MNAPDAAERAAVMQWRRDERERLIAARMALSVDARQAASARIAAQVDAYARKRQLLPPGTRVSGYWPLRGEPDLRPWLRSLHEAGFTCLMPVVREQHAPLVFRRWTPGCAMEKGFWNIPVPVATEEFTPQLLLAPLVGFDAACFRLGYGGGYFDRTLALLASEGRQHQVIGVGYELGRLPSIRPLAHDIALQAIVTESALLTPPST